MAAFRVFDLDVSKRVFDDDFTRLRAGRGLVLEPSAGSSTTA
jgi:hypothetical protein